MAMVGGGPGSFIGPVHRMAAVLDGAIELVAGAFSRDAARSVDAARQYGVELGRAYPSYLEMLKGEGRPGGADFIAVVTPNASHFDVARAALEAGYHVVSDKPVTATLAEAQRLKSIVRASSRLYAVTYTYTGYPLVREARELCRSGALGAVRKLIVEYTQGWLSEPLERKENRQAAWRTDPSQAGAGGCVADIGVHAFNLLEFVTGRQVISLCADLSRIVPGRRLDDDCNVLARLDNGAPALLHASQVAFGERNRLELRVYAEKGSLAWSHEDPNRLHIAWQDGPEEVRHAGSAKLCRVAQQAMRLPAGHPEGYIEAFANIYREVANVLGRREGGHPDAWSETLCGIEEGERGMRFIELAVESSRRSAWVDFE